MSWCRRWHAARRAIEVRGVSAASGEVGGDLVDVVETDSGWTAYVVDVSGHGVGSGLLMGMVKSAARVALRGDTELGALLTLLNGVIFDLKSPAMYTTFAGLQWRDGALSFAVAAHPAILRCRRGSPTVDELTMTQLPIAMFEDTVFAATPLDTRPGDLFVILTDGLTEVFDRAEQEFGLERMKAMIAAHAEGPLEALEQWILDAVRGTAGSWTINRCCWCGSCKRLRSAGRLRSRSQDSGVVRLRQRLDHDVLHEHLALGVVPLQRERAARQHAGRHVRRPLHALGLRVVVQRLAVHLLVTRLPFTTISW